MIDLKRAVPIDWTEIRRIAYTTWPDTFGEVISAEQLEYILSKTYNEASIKDQMLNMLFANIHEYAVRGLEIFWGLWLFPLGTLV